MRGRERQQRIGRQVVVQNGIGLFEDAASLDGDQFRIARPRADEINLSGGHKTTFASLGPAQNRVLHDRRAPIRLESDQKRSIDLLFPKVFGWIPTELSR